MKRLLILFLLIVNYTYSQVSIRNLPEKTTNFLNGDLLIINDSAQASGATKKITVGDFKTNYSFGSGSSSITGLTPSYIPYANPADSTELLDSWLYQTADSVFIASGKYIRTPGNLVITADGSFTANGNRILIQSVDSTVIYGKLNLNAQTASSIPFVNAGKTIQPLTIGTGLSLSSGTLSATGGGTSYWTTTPETPVRSTNRIIKIYDASNAGLYDKLLDRTTVLKWTDTDTKVAMVVSATYSSDTVTITTVGDTISTSATLSTFKYALNKCKPLVFAIAGTIATGTDLTARYYSPCALKVFGADAYHATAGTTNATTYDINKNGSSVFSTVVSVASASTSGTGFSADSGTTTASGDYISVDCDSVSTTAPVDLYLQLFTMPLNDIYLD